jgi:CRP-like cAMP-binding protein
MSYAFSPATKTTSENTKLSYYECLEYFVAHLQGYGCFASTDLLTLERYFDYYSVKKNKKLITAGQVCQELKFICSGNAKYYTEDENGKYILSFFTGSNFCANVESFYYQAESNNSAISCTDIYGLRISHPNFQKLLRERPAFDAFFKKLIFNEINYLKKRVRELLSMDARERCRQLESEHPLIFEKFKLIDISNYLGIKPETLVRLRKAQGREINPVLKLVE